MSATDSTSRFYCHSCSRDVQPLPDLSCPNCEDGFVEEVEPDESEESSRDEGSGGSGSASQGPASDGPSPQVLHFTSGPHHASFSSTGNLLNSILQSVFSGLSGGVPSHHHPHPSVFLPMPSMQLSGNVGDYAWGPGGLDSIITRLLDAMEDGPSAPPASQSIIDQLPTVTISQEHIDMQSSCSVCFDEFHLDNTARQLPCTHLFHPDCVVPWLQRHNTCPVCRQSCESSELHQ